MKHDTRGVVPLIGVILLFGILVIGLSMFQATIVPQQNAEVEFNHNERVQGDMVEFRDTIVNIGSNPYDESTEASATLGTQYPFRVLTINPAPAPGTVSSQPPDDNIVITKTSGDELANKSTNNIQYEPQYREYTTAPTTTIEHTLIYNSFAEVDENITRSGEHIFQNDRVVIPLLKGEFSETDVERISVSLSSGNRIVEDVSENVTIRLPTAVPEIWIEQVNQRGDNFQLVGESSDYIGENYVKIEANITAYELQTVDVGDVEVDGPIRFVPGEEPTVVTHSEINRIEDFANETLVIPEGDDFVPEEGSEEDDGENNQGEDVIYEFNEYQIDGNIQTSEQIELTATEGEINFGSEGSAISGRELEFVARGENGGINVDGANIETTGGSTGQGTVGIRFDTTGSISAVDTTMESDGTIEILADGSIDLSGADILVDENNDVIIDAGGSIDITDANINITGNGDVTVNASEGITATGSEIQPNSGDTEIQTENGSVDLENAKIATEGNNDIQLEADERISVIQAELDIDGNGDATAEATQIEVTDARFIDGADPLETTGEVIGSPEEGNTE